MLEKLKVLVLNKSYEPMRFCAAKRAILMVLKGRAEQVEKNGVMIHSFSISFPCPSVIRLNRYIKLPHYGGVSFSKKNVLRRDKRTCQYCGATNVELTVDHIIPRSLGGGSNWLNVVTACKTCNLKKGNRSHTTIGMKLRRKPYRPKSLAILTQPNTVPEGFSATWKKYLHGIR